MAEKETQVDVTWVHNVVGIAATFQSEDNGRAMVINSTTILGALPHQEGEEPIWIVCVEGSETDRGEYWWPIEEYWCATHTPDGTPLVDEATDEQIATLYEEEEEEESNT